MDSMPSAINIDERICHVHINAPYYRPRRCPKPKANHAGEWAFMISHTGDEATHLLASWALSWEFGAGQIGKQRCCRDDFTRRDCSSGFMFAPSE
jgi:hypothetical protein